MTVIGIKIIIRLQILEFKYDNFYIWGKSVRILINNGIEYMRRAKNYSPIKERDDKVINHLFDKLIDDLREKHINEINTSEEIIKSEINCASIIQKLEKTLSEEQKNFLQDIEEQSLDANLIQFKYLYRAGIYDGVELSRNIKNCGFDEYNFQQINSSNSALEAYREFKKLRGTKEECNPEIYELIIFIFNKGYEVGLFNGKHDIRI